KVVFFSGDLTRWKRDRLFLSRGSELPRQACHPPISGWAAHQDISPRRTARDELSLDQRRERGRLRAHERRRFEPLGATHEWHAAETVDRFYFGADFLVRLLARWQTTRALAWHADKRRDLDQFQTITWRHDHRFQHEPQTEDRPASLTQAIRRQPVTAINDNDGAVDVARRV